MNQLFQNKKLKITLISSKKKLKQNFTKIIIQLNCFLIINVQETTIQKTKYSKSQSLSNLSTLN